MKNNRCLKEKKGISLIEVVVAISLLSILSYTFSNIYIESIRTISIESTESQLQTDSQTALDRITNEVKGAQDISDTYSTYTSGETVVILKIPAIDEDQNILYAGESIVSDYTVYYLQSESLHRKVYADTSSARYPQNERDYIIATGVKDLSFEYDSAPPQTSVVTITITFGKDSGKIYREVTLTGIARLRNL